MLPGGGSLNVSSVYQDLSVVPAQFLSPINFTPTPLSHLIPIQCLTFLVERIMWYPQTPCMSSPHQISRRLRSTIATATYTSVFWAPHQCHDSSFSLCLVLHLFPCNVCIIPVRQSGLNSTQSYRWSEAKWRIQMEIFSSQVACSAFDGWNESIDG